MHALACNICIVSLTSMQAILLYLVAWGNEKVGSKLCAVESSVLPSMELAGVTKVQPG